jgi:hypothetical protein
VQKVGTNGRPFTLPCPEAAEQDLVYSLHNSPLEDKLQDCLSDWKAESANAMICYVKHKLTYSVSLPFWLLVLQLWPVPTAAQPVAAPKLNIVVVEGEAAINNIRLHSAQAPSVRIEDENKKPLAGVAVVFTLPSSGPSGSFANGDKTLMTTTDAQGVAAARGLKPNSVEGQLEIHVNASLQGQTARAVITQFNMAVPSASKHGSGKLIAILAVVGGAAAGGAFAATHKSSSSPSSVVMPSGVSSPISITPGVGVVGPPR